MTPETKSAYNTAEEWMNRLIIYNTFKKEKIPFYSYDEEFTDVKPIGRKSSGKIYKATLRSLRKTVTIKSINLTVDDAMNEVKKHRILENHDNILKFYGITRQGDYMLVFEYANNGTLRQYLRENYQRMNWNVKLSLARQIAGVIGFLHANEIVYEKLDSGNIFVHNGKIKLSGFEIRRQSINASRQNSNSQYLESPGVIYRKTSLDRNSLGILLWEISNGTPPKVITSENREHVIGTPRAYVKICEDCCQPNKNQWPSIEQVIRELDEIVLSEMESGFFNLTSSLGRTKNVNMENGIAAESDSFTSEMDLFMKNLFTFFSELFVKQHLDMMPICIKKFIKDHNKNPTKILYHLVNQRRPYYTSMVGFFYKHSIGTIADNKIALEFYSQATNGVIDERDNSSDLPSFVKSFQKDNKAIGQILLANIYLYGKGVAKDEKRAFRLFEKTAKEGSTRALNYIGFCYEYGLGVEKNDSKAFELYLKAAEQGNLVAQCNVGYCFQEGIGTGRDEKKSYIWYSKSAMGGNIIAYYCVGEIYFYGRGVKKDEQFAFQYYSKSAENDYDGSQCDIGYCYGLGIGTVKDENKAFENYMKAAKNGNVVSQRLLGVRYVNGTGTSRDFIKAIYWLNLAKENGDADAADLLREIINQIIYDLS